MWHTHARTHAHTHTHTWDMFQLFSINRPLQYLHLKRDFLHFHGHACTVHVCDIGADRIVMQTGIKVGYMHDTHKHRHTDNLRAHVHACKPTYACPEYLALSVAASSGSILVKSGLGCGKRNRYNYSTFINWILHSMECAHVQTVAG